MTIGGVVEGLIGAIIYRDLGLSSVCDNFAESIDHKYRGLGSIYL